MLGYLVFPVSAHARFPDTAAAQVQPARTGCMTGSGAATQGVAKMHHGPGASRAHGRHCNEDFLHSLAAMIVR